LKKYIIYFIVYLIVIFILPATFTKNSKEKILLPLNNNSKQQVGVTDKYNYSKYSKIKLYHTDNQEIQELEIDDYIYGAVSAEMPASYDIEALKAQAIVSRTYTLYQIINNKHNDVDICDDYGCCQAWISKEDRLKKWAEEERESNWNKIVEAVDSTSGKIITYNNDPINAFFHSNSGGITEAVSNIWGEKKLPYLQSVETSGEDEYKQYSSEVILTKEELIEKIKIKHSEIQINWNEENCIEILEYTNSQRVKTLKVGNVKIAGTEARSLLGLKSTNFTYKIDGEKVIFSVIGYGHGVGMSQTGADSLAKVGKNYEEIIKHFYTGVEITNVNDLK